MATNIDLFQIQQLFTICNHNLSRHKDDAQIIFSCHVPHVSLVQKLYNTKSDTCTFLSMS